MGRRLWALIRKEFIQIGRDRRTLAMMLVMPLLWLTVFGYAATFDVREIPVGVANLSDSTVTVKLVEALKTEEALRIAEGYHSREELRSAIERGNLRFGLLIPPGFGRPPAEGQEPAQPEVLADGSDFFATQAGLRVLFPALARGAVPGGQPAAATPKVEILYNPQLRSANVMIPALTGLVMMFITSLMTALGIVREKEQGTLEQIVVSPITPLELILGKLVPYTLIGLLDLALVVGWQ